MAWWVQVAFITFKNHAGADLNDFRGDYLLWAGTPGMHLDVMSMLVLSSQQQMTLSHLGSKILDMNMSTVGLPKEDARVSQLTRSD